MKAVIELVDGNGLSICCGCIFNTGEGNCSEIPEELIQVKCGRKIWVLKEIVEE